MSIYFRLWWASLQKTKLPTEALEQLKNVLKKSVLRYQMVTKAAELEGSRSQSKGELIELVQSLEVAFPLEAFAKF